MDNKKEIEVERLLQDVNKDYIDLVNSIVEKYKKSVDKANKIVRNVLIFLAFFIFLFMFSVTYFLTHVSIEVESYSKQSTQTIYTDYVEGGVVNENNK